jgi:hypothetical protein
MADVARWISVGELAHAFGPGNNTPRPTDDLAGQTLRLHLESGQVVEHRLVDSAKLVWRVLEGSGAGREVEEAYIAHKVRDGIYFVDFVRHLERAVSASIVLDTRLGIVTVLIGRLPGATEARRPLVDRMTEGKDVTAVRATFLSGALDKVFSSDTPRHLPTEELVGRRVLYAYSSTERYEHVYLNANFYTWHCLSGSEKGLADTDRCHCLKIADDLFFFVWREKLVPTLGAVLVDFDIMRTVGKIFGYQGADFDKVVNFSVGAHARLLNVTRHDDGQPREIDQF